MQIARERQLNPSLLMFEPYPRAFLTPDKSLPRLTSLREKIFILNGMHMPFIYCLRFDSQIAKMSADTFIKDLLIQQLNVKYLILGEDFRFGYKREGDIAKLKKIEQFVVESVPLYQHNGEKVSSTRIRQVLREGDLMLAEKLLGRPYMMMGRIVKGDQRGRLLGFPTANINMRRRVLPIDGVFAVKVYGIQTNPLLGVANVGKRPTIDGVANLLEIHLFNFSQDIYGKHIRVEFMQKIRDTQRFSSVAALQAQIAEDASLAKKFFNM